jgi:hypothetical protein
MSRTGTSNSLDAVVEQRIPRPVNPRQEPAGGEAQHVRPVLDAGRRAARVSEKNSDWRRWDAAAARESGWVRRWSYGGGLRSRGGQREAGPVGGGGAGRGKKRERMRCGSPRD